MKKSIFLKYLIKINKFYQMANILLVPYKDEYEEEISNLLVEAYMVRLNFYLKLAKQPIYKAT
jgi:hypothetical protein